MSNKEPETPSLKAMIVSYRAIADMMDAHKLPQPTTQYLRTLLDRVEAACRRAYNEIYYAVSATEVISSVDIDYIRMSIDQTIGDYYE